FKTKLCVYVSTGVCPHGERCFFAHSISELRVPPPSALMVSREKGARRVREARCSRGQ
ncbi:hypothetical protein M885DRAFT_413488, partial [Pelagophyceae sp. CCMP2097]